MPHQIFHESVVYLYVLTLSIILTVAYIQGLLTSFLQAGLSIISCAFDLIFGKIFLGWVSRTRDAIAFRITDPVNSFIDRIPRGFKAMFFTLLGYSIFVLDHLYNTTLFAEDETTFYDIVIYGHKYWITDYALMIGGVFLSYGLLYFFILISEVILYFVDRRIKIFVVVRR